MNCFDYFLVYTDPAVRRRRIYEVIFMQYFSLMLTLLFLLGIGNESFKCIDIGSCGGQAPFWFTGSSTFYY